MIRGMFQLPDSENAPPERRKTSAAQKVSIGGITISVGLLIAIFQQLASQTTEIAALVQMRVHDQAAMALMQSDMRNLSQRITDILPVYDRRIDDVERNCAANRERLDHAQAQITGMPAAWQAAIAMGNARVLDEVRAMVGAERMRYVPRTLNGESRLLSIAEAVARVPGDEPALWTYDGRPTVAAVRSRFGGHVSAGEVEAAWGLILSSPGPAATPITDFSGDRTAEVDP